MARKTPLTDDEMQKVRSKTDLQRECERVNAILKAEAERLQLGKKGSLERLWRLQHNSSAFLQRAELEFREFVRRELEKSTCVSSTDVILRGADKLGISQLTTKRYMEILRVPCGPFSGLGDVVILNPNYISKEEDPYWE